MERLLNSPFSRGTATNIDERTVQVQLDGDQKQIAEFIRNLKKAVAEKFGNPAISFTPFQENPGLEIPGLIWSSQALVVGQLQKGISVQIEILHALKELPKELGKILKGSQAKTRSNAAAFFSI